MTDPQARILIGSSPVAAGNRHTYLIFERSDGSQTVVRGGPTRSPDGDPLVALADSAALGSDRFGDIKVSSSPYQSLYPAYQRATARGLEPVPVAEADPSDPSLKKDARGQPYLTVERGIDWPLPGEHHERRELWTGTDAELQVKLQAARQAGRQITDAGLEYSPLSNNCNNVSTALLKAIDVTPKLPVTEDGTAVSAPAFGEPLHQNIGPGGWRSGYRFDGKTWSSEEGQPIRPPVKPAADGSLDNAPPSRSGPSSSAQIEGSAANGSGLLDPSNPAHGLYLQAYAGVARLDAQYGRAPDLQSQQFAAALAVQSKADGLASIEQVLLNNDGTRAFAVDNADASAPWARRSAIDVLAAVQQPLDASNAALERLNTQASHQQQHLQATEVQAQSAPRMG